ncbi:MAG: alpha/beta fold hydrolase [Phycisphaerae bacterium]
MNVKAMALVGLTGLILLCCAVQAVSTQAAEIPAEIGRRYEGWYRQPNVPADVHVFWQGGALRADLPGKPTIQLIPVAEHSFSPDFSNEIQIVFDVKEGRATGYTFRSPDKTSRAVRVTKERRAGDVRLDRRTLQLAAGETVDAEFGRFVVPENRESSSSRLLELAFVRLKSKAAAPTAPLIYLAGGPGNSSTKMADSPGGLARWRPLLAIGDVVLFDQRGTGNSEPGMSWRSNDPIPDGVFVTADAAVDHVVSLGQQAANHLRDKGIDFDGYTTRESAADVRDLAIALSADRVSLLGFSYGTHLALATIRYYPEILENVVVCGVEGPDDTYKLPLNMDVQFQKLAKLVARDVEISRQIPDLNALLLRVFDKLERKPMLVEVRDPRTNDPIEVPVGKFGLQMLMRFDIGDATDLPVFPRLLHTIDNGDPSVLTWFVQKRIGLLARVSGMSFLVDAASGASPGRMATIREQAKASIFGNVMNFPFLYERVTDVWQANILDEEFRQPVISDVRTLFLSGTLDWNTPPYQAEQVRWGFSRSTHLIVENAGHEQVLPQPAIQDAVVSFLRGNDVHDVKVVLPSPVFVPLAGFNADAPHASVDPRAEFNALAIGPGEHAAAARLGEEIARAYWNSAFELNEFAWQLVADGRFGKRFYDLALKMSVRCNELTERKNWMYVDTLAHIQYARGDVDKAIELGTLAVNLAGDDPRADEVREALARFERRK